MGLFRDLEAKVAGMENQGDKSKAFECFAGRFYCQADVERYLKENPMATIMGLVDVFSLMVLMVKDAMTGTEHSKRIHSAAQVFREAGESDLLATFTHERPWWLFCASTGKDKDKLVKQTEGFGVNMKSYKEYDSTHTSSKIQMTNWIQDYVKGLEEGFDRLNPSDMLKAELVRNAERHAGEVLNFITNYYLSLIHI